MVDQCLDGVHCAPGGLFSSADTLSRLGKDSQFVQTLEILRRQEGEMQHELKVMCGLLRHAHVESAPSYPTTARSHSESAPRVADRCHCTQKDLGSTPQISQLLDLVKVMTGSMAMLRRHNSVLKSMCCQMALELQTDVEANKRLSWEKEETLRRCAMQQDHILILELAWRMGHPPPLQPMYPQGDMQDMAVPHIPFAQECALGADAALIEDMPIPSRLCSRVFTDSSCKSFSPRWQPHTLSEASTASSTLEELPTPSWALESSMFEEQMDSEEQHIERIPVPRFLHPYAPEASTSSVCSTRRDRSPLPGLAHQVDAPDSGRSGSSEIWPRTSRELYLRALEHHQQLDSLQRGCLQRSESVRLRPEPLAQPHQQLPQARPAHVSKETLDAVCEEVRALPVAALAA